MDAKFLFWSGALLNMVVMFGLLGNGVRQIRRGNVAAHKRSMLGATALVLAFLVAYLFKVPLLGREDFSLWSRPHLWNLRFHETCVLLMLVAGAVAAWRARAMRATRNVTRERDDPLAPESVVRAHKRAGWTAITAASLALLTATVVLIGMYGRL